MKNFKSRITGALCLLLGIAVGATAVTASASSGARTINAVYKDIKILLFGEDESWGFSVRNAAGLTLQAAPGADVELVTPYRYAEVLTFDGCNGVTLKGIKAGHSVTDCSLRAVSIGNSAEVRFENCKFVDNRAYSNIILASQADAAFINCEISGNHGLERGVVEASFFANISLEGCNIFDNANSEVNPDYVISGEFISDRVTLKDCTVEKAGFGDYWNNRVVDLGGNTLK